MQVQTRTLVKRDNKKHQRYITMQLQTQTKNSSQFPSADEYTKTHTTYIEINGRRVGG